MVTQLHLALVMAIDARLLVLDEPTLGLDILYRKQFYDSLLNDYFDRSRTIVVTTHQVEEVQHVLTDLMFINRGRIVLDCSMEEFESRYLEVTVHPEQVAAARALKPMHERQVLGRSILLFDPCRSSATCRTWRRAHAQHRRPVRCRDGQSGRPGTRSGTMNTQVECDARAVRRRRASRPRTIPASRAFVLVGATRTVGEPFHLYGASGRRYGRCLCLLDQLDHGYLGAATETGSNCGLRCRTTWPPVLLMLTAIIVSVFYCLDASAERASRSQHPVLEITAGFRSHDRAGEGEHSSDGRAAAHVCDHDCYAVDHVAGEQRSAAGKWPERRDAVEKLATRKHVAIAAVPPGDGPCALAVSYLLLAAAGLRLGAACNILMGSIAARRDGRSREHRVPNKLLRRTNRAPVSRRSASHEYGTG